MLFLDIEDDRVLGMIADNRAVALIRLRHKILARRVPMRVHAENGNLRADIMRRLHPTDSQDVSRHRTRRRLSVHPRDDDAFFLPHDRRQRIRPPHHRDAEFHRCVKVRVPRLNRRRVNHQLCLADFRRVRRRGKIQPERLQPRRLDSRRLVAPTHAMPERNTKPRDPAHARARHPNEVDAARFRRKKRCEL